MTAPTWRAPDPAAWQAARESLPPEPSPSWPGPTEYLADLGLHLQRFLLGWIEGAVPVWLASEVVWLTLVYGIAGLALAAILIFAVRRWRSRRAPKHVVEHPLIPVDAAPRLPGPEAWRDRYRAALAQESWGSALQALWWWTATSLAPPGLSPAWTTDELIGRSAAERLRRPLGELDRLRYGETPPDRATLVALEGGLREELT